MSKYQPKPPIYHELIVVSFSHGFGSWFPVWCDSQKPTVDAETPKDMSPLFAIARITSVTLNIIKQSNRMCRPRWFQLFQCGKKRQKRLNKLKPPWAAMLVTLSSRTNLSVKSSVKRKKFVGSDSSGDAVPRAVPTSATLPVGPKTGWKFPFVGCFWRVIWYFIHIHTCFMSCYPNSPTKCWSLAEFAVLYVEEGKPFHILGRQLWLWWKQ